MITVHGRATSVNVQTVMWTIGELALPHRRLDVGASFGGNRTTEYLAMNPNGLVPVVQDGDLTLFESAAILRYLAARYGDETFWPRDPAGRAALDQWAEWIKTSFVSGMMPMFLQHIWIRGSERNPETIAKATADLARFAPMLDARIGEGPWLGGGDFTFADILAGHQLYRYYTLPFERAPTPNLDAYYARLQNRPAFAEHVMVSYESLRAQ